MGWLIALGVLVALAWLPLGISLRYDEDGFCFRLLAGWVPISLGGKQKEKKKDKQKSAPKKQKKKKSNQSTAAQKTEKKKGGALTDFLPLVETVLEFLSAFRGKLRIRRLEMKLIMAADDPCDLAVNYGRAWAALGNLIPQLERFFVIKKRNLEVECDFEATKTVITARADLVITLGRLLWLLLWYGVQILRKYFDLQKLRKGGASK